MNNLDIFAVSSKDLVPRQQKTSVGFIRKTDSYQRYMLKFSDEIAQFHSRAEIYHAALLEADPLVTHFVPQPYILRVGRERYCPDMFYLREGKRHVVELKPRGEFDDKKRRSLEAYFDRYKITFSVLDNEQFYRQSILAENWLVIISQLYTHRHFITDTAEVDILDELSLDDSLTLGQIIDPGNRIGSLQKETALFRLLHRGLIKADLSDDPLDYQTRFSVCC